MSQSSTHYDNLCHRPSTQRFVKARMTGWRHAVDVIGSTDTSDYPLDSTRDSCSVTPTEYTNDKHDTSENPSRCDNAPGSEMPINLSPHLAKLQNARLVCMSEPERSGFNTSVLKRLFGGEKISSRMLRQNEVSFKVLAKGFIACKNMPTIDATDAGVWRRIIVIPFTSRFVETPVPLMSSR